LRVSELICRPFSFPPSSVPGSPYSWAPLSPSPSDADNNFTRGPSSRALPLPDKAQEYRPLRCFRPTVPLRTFFFNPSFPCRYLTLRESPASNFLFINGPFDLLPLLFHPSFCIRLRVSLPSPTSPIRSRRSSYNGVVSSFKYFLPKLTPPISLIFNGESTLSDSIFFWISLLFCTTPASSVKIDHSPPALPVSEQFGTRFNSEKLDESA